MGNPLKRFAKKIYEKRLGELLAQSASALRLACIVGLGVTTWAQLSGSGAWPPSRAMFAMMANQWYWLLLILFVTTFAAFDVRAWLERFSTGPSDRVSIYLEKGLAKLRPGIRTLVENEFENAIEMLLVAAQLAIEEQLGIVGKNLIQVNLLWVTNGTPKKLLVAARSKPGNTPVEHAWEGGILACRAMTDNKTVVQCNIKKLAGYELKPYDCVVATPIVERDRAFGAITADSTESETFAGCEVAMDRILRPIAEAILLTRPGSSPFVQCPERNVR